MAGAAITSCYGPRWGALHAGIDFAQVTRELESEGVKAFADAYDGMIAAIAEKRESIATSA